MHRLGISLYPEHSTPDKDYAYMELAAMNGFSRIFTCLLSVEKNAEDTIAAVGRMGRVGMKSTDVEILNIMLGN